MEEIRQFRKQFWYEQRLADSKSKVRKLCKCGHSLLVPAYIQKVKCSYCGCWVFHNKKDEFNYKLEIALRKKKYEQVSQ